MTRSGGNDMTYNALGYALALGLTTLALSSLPVTTAQAVCEFNGQTTKDGPTCPPGWRYSRKEVIKEGGPVGSFSEVKILCCTTPSEPYATGGQTPPQGQGTPIDKIETDPKAAPSPLVEKEKCGATARKRAYSKSIKKWVATTPSAPRTTSTSTTARSSRETSLA
jgi:hypothetical protein